MSNLFATPSRDNRLASSPPGSASSQRHRAVSDEDDGVCAFWLHCSQFFTTQRLGNQEGSSDRIRLALPDVLHDKLLTSSQRLSAHSADLLSLKRGGGYASATGVLSGVLKGTLPLTSSNITMQRVAAHTTAGHHESVLSSFPNATRRQAESIVALAPARRSLVHHHRCGTALSVHGCCDNFPRDCDFFVLNIAFAGCRTEGGNATATPPPRSLFTGFRPGSWFDP
jgi:hypothetical protein